MGIRIYPGVLRRGVTGVRSQSGFIGRSTQVQILPPLPGPLPRRDLVRRAAGSECQVRSLAGAPAKGRAWGPQGTAGDRGPARAQRAVQRPGGGRRGSPPSSIPSSSIGSSARPLTGGLGVRISPWEPWYGSADAVSGQRRGTRPARATYAPVGESGRPRLPVKQKTAGSNPVRSA